MADISKSTLLLVGFTEVRASQIWDHWSNWPDDEIIRPESEEGGEMSFLEIMTAAIQWPTDTTSPRDQDWIAAMTTWGIEPELQQAIVDPMFNLIRHSESCAFWVKDTIKMRYAALQRAQARATEPTGRDLRNEAEAEAARTRTTAARNTPDHTIVYKGIDEGRVTDLVQDWDPQFLGQLLIASKGQSDYSPGRLLCHFTAQRWLAQYFASWIARRSPSDNLATVKPIIVQLSIPNSILRGMSETELLSLHFPDESWKRLVWHSRNGRCLPQDLAKYYDATLIVGTISRGNNVMYRKMRSWEEISENHVLKIGPQEVNAIQFGFTDYPGCCLLEDNMAWFSKEYFGPQDYLAWRHANVYLLDTAWDPSGEADSAVEEVSLPG